MYAYCNRHIYEVPAERINGTLQMQIPRQIKNYPIFLFCKLINYSNFTGFPGRPNKKQFFSDFFRSANVIGFLRKKYCKPSFNPIL